MAEAPDLVLSVNEALRSLSEAVNGKVMDGTSNKGCFGEVSSTNYLLPWPKLDGLHHRTSVFSASSFSDQLSNFLVKLIIKVLIFIVCRQSFRLWARIWEVL